jgi:hypothetical protein
MIKRTVLIITLAAGVGATLPQSSDASYECMTGRITAVTGNTITAVSHRESRTFTVDRQTRFTAWPTDGRWQSIAPLRTRQLYCNSRLLEVGRLVTIHPRHDGTDTARWVQVAINDAGNGYGADVCIR